MNTKVYAKGTVVSVEKSRMEIDTLLGKHGAQQRSIGQDDARAVGMIVFVLDEQKYRIEVPMPDRNRLVKENRPRHWYRLNDNQRDVATQRMFEQASRERWRSLVLLLKAKLEIVRMGASTFEREFLADQVLPNGATFHQVASDLRMALAANPGTLALPERT